MTLEELHYSKIWTKFWEGCMWVMQCNVEFVYQLRICSGIEENHGKPWSIWPVTGPSGCKMTPSQQSSIKYANTNISPYLAVALFEKKSLHIFSTVFLHNLDEQQRVACNICRGGGSLYTDTCIQTYILWRYFGYWRCYPTDKTSITRQRLGKLRLKAGILKYIA
jgi:hypothetical protein